MLRRTRATPLALAALVALAAGPLAWAEGAAPDGGGGGTGDAVLVERVSALEGAYEHLATKADLAELRAELKADMEALRGEFKADMAALRGELKADMERLGGDVNGRISGLEGQLQTLILVLGGIAALIATFGGLLVRPLLAARG